MDRKYIDDHHIVGRYLAEQLAEDERMAFEAYCLQHPDVVQEMEAAARLKVGLMGLRSRGELQQTLQARAWFWRRPVIAVAAVALLAVSTAFITLRLPEVQPVLAANRTTLQTVWGRPLAVANTYSVLRVRGARYALEVEKPARSQVIEWRVLPEFAAGRYQTTLSLLVEGKATQKIAELGNLESETDGYVPVFVNGARLGRGRYELVLVGDTGAGEARSRFLIRVR